jgi:uncharacterized protein
MELVNDFTVNVPVDEAWKTLTDVERIAPALPGAQLEEVEGDVYRGKVKVKVGPILAQFKGQATFVEKDDSNHKAVLKAEGRETGGKGNASALITAQLVPEGSASTKVTVTTDLTITGKVAQFGRGALADVSTKLLGQFVDNLETTVLGQGSGDGGSATTSTAASASTTTATTATSTEGNGSTTATSDAAAPATPGVRKITGPEAKPVDLLDAAGAPILKRLLPVIGVVVVLVVLLRIRRKRHRD